MAGGCVGGQSGSEGCTPESTAVDTRIGDAEIAFVDDDIEDGGVEDGGDANTAFVANEDESNPEQNSAPRQCVVPEP